MKILLLGKNGQVGQALQHALAPLGMLIAQGRDNLDLSHLASVPKHLRAIAPDIIVNAAAYTAVDKAEHEQQEAYTLNEKAVRIMADYAQTVGCLFIHYSTDYVFNGRKKEPYLETDCPDPLNVYGHSKLAGERAILQSQCHAVIFRTSWVVSVNGHNFIKTILRLAKERQQIQVVEDQYGAPTSANLIAYVTKKAIQQYIQQGIEKGIYHLTAKGVVSWHGLAHYIVERAKINNITLQLSTEAIKAIPSEAYPLPARRPLNSCLNTDKLSQLIGDVFPDWALHVNDIVDDLCNK